MILKDSAHAVKPKRTHALGAFLILLGSACLPVLGAGQEQPAEPDQLLTKYFGFSPGQVVQVRQGDAVVKILKPQKHEVGVVVVTRVNVPMDFMAARFRDIERHKKSEAVLIVRKLSDPPQTEDFAVLTLLPQDLSDLQGCQSGQCPVKFSMNQIDAFQRLDLDAANASEASALMRSLLADYAREYSIKGNRAMVVYNDKSSAVDSAAQFRDLLDESPYLQEYAPEFFDYLHDFPEKTLPGVDRFLYWSREVHGHSSKTITGLTDAVVYRRAADKSPAVLLASKQIYANHYFESSLGLSMLFAPTSSDPAPSFYLVYVNRSRIDLLRKWYSGFLRGRISDSVASFARKQMIETRNKVETEYAADQAVPSGGRNHFRRSSSR